ncbi:LuxR C-terminal-related transcriptional regulator [Actinoplanes subglobosus]|uniref:LuxR C-terminal-related transcriptional regulator n=1 Tax=Actinoplanes subglobosus TaxID=1547892 RepID=A0ABV8J8Q9_9ACTN
MTERQLHVSIAHSDRMVRTGLYSILAGDSRFLVLDPVPALASLSRAFDVCVSDIHRVGTPEEIRDRLRTSSTVVLTAVDHFEALTAAWVGGARDILRTDDDPATIRQAVLEAGAARPEGQPVQLSSHVAAALRLTIEHAGASALKVDSQGSQQSSGVDAGLTVSVGLIEALSRMEMNGRIDAILQDPRIHKAFAVPDPHMARARYVGELEQFRLDCAGYGLGLMPDMTLRWGVEKVEMFDPKPHLSVLTPMQRAVMEHLADGLTNEQAARELRIQPRTVQTHTSQAMQRYSMSGHRQSAHLKMLVAQFVTGRHTNPDLAHRLLLGYGFNPVEIVPSPRRKRR